MPRMVSSMGMGSFRFPAGGGSTSAVFMGNPNVTISGINTSGGIVASRTSGLTPCAVHVDASLITATGTSIPYEDLEFSWNFGEPSGTETVTDPTTGLGVNLNNCQTGPQAAYIYRTAGTYPVTLSIRGQNGTGFTTASVTQNIVVSAFVAAADFFIDFGAAGGGSGTIGSPFNTITQVNTALASAVDSTRFNFKRGSSITGATGIDMSGLTLNHIRFNDYGSGALPIITVNSTNNGFFTNNGGASTPRPQDDIVISNINFQTATGWNSPNGAVVGVGLGNASATVTNFCLDGLPIANNIDPSTVDSNVVDFAGNATLISKVLIWKCTVSSLLSSTLTNHNRMGIGGGIKQFFAVVGTSVSGSGHSPATQDHHIYIHCQNYCYGGFNTFGPSATAGNAPTKNMCFKRAFDSGEGDGTFYAQWFSLNRNFMSGTRRANDMANGTNDPAVTRMRYSVSQQNVMTGLDCSSDGGGIVVPFTGETCTERDHKVYGCFTGVFGGWWAPAPLHGTTTFLVANVYRNKIYKTTASGLVFDYTAFTWTTMQTVTDNIVYDTVSTANLIDIVFADQTSAGSVIDRNNWYAPAATSGLFSSGSQVSLATWKAGTWDAHVNTVTGSNNANPGWADPANGVF